MRTESHWLRLLGHATVPVDGKDSSVPIAAAFSLERSSQPDRPRGKSADRPRKGGGAGQRYRIAPLDAGQVSIYFPAVKETSGLRFHIHAPFASTVARDSVRATPENDALVSAIGSLVSDALPQLRDDGLLDDGLLSSLPNAEDSLAHPYDTVRYLIMDAFKGQELTPVHGGGAFAAASELVSSPQAFRGALSAMDLDFLVQIGQPQRDAASRWIASRDGRAGRFLRGLEVDEFEWAELVDRLGQVAAVFRANHESSETDRLLAQAWHGWLESKENASLRRLYELLGQATRENYRLKQGHLLPSVPIVRLIQRGVARHVNGPSTYLPSKSSDTAASRVPIDLAYFADESAEKDNVDLRLFYEHAGVKRWDERAKVLDRLRAYEATDKPDPSSKRHFDDIRLFCKFLRDSPNQASLFSGKRFLWAVRTGAMPSWCAAEAVYIDEPFRSTGLASILDGLSPSGAKHRLWDGYIDEIDDMGSFANAVGCQSQLAIKHVNVWENPEFKWSWRSGRWTSQGTRRDWDLEHFGPAIASGDAILFHGLWEIVSRTPASHAHAVFRLNASAPEYTIRSQLAQRLESTSFSSQATKPLRGHL